MLVLGIESSCDETGIAVVKLNEDRSIEILAEEVSSQVDVHVEYGGVVPELASREHLKNLPLIYKRVLDKSGVSLNDLDGIAATRGPGLKGCLLMGYGFAKALSLSVNKTFLGVNHIEGHVLAPLLDNPELDFPYLSLVVSGGHTEIHEVQGLGQYKLIARTIDDAAGEAFDKSAHLLGFSYPGGPKLAALADTCGESSFELPKVMRGSQGFSFSGLKTAIALLIKKHQAELEAGNEDLKAEIAHAVQESIVDALIFKLSEALESSEIKTITVTGGVSANKRLRERVSELDAKTYFPKPAHCVDNAAMIALTGAMRLSAGEDSGLSAEVLSRWPIETLGVAA